ncbi:MAG: hypothetical protein WCT01_05125 [Candidatus Shapirobacteria bacterium]
MKSSYLLPLLSLSFVLLTACTSPVTLNTKNKNAQFSSDDEPLPTLAPYEDELANAPVNFTKSVKLNSEFKVDYKTSNPDGVGLAEFKAKSMKVIPDAGGSAPQKGKKLVLVEIGVKGKASNKGVPSTFNQIGDTPSPQFVLVDKSKNLSHVEETYYSDSYTVQKKLFELSKITLDHEQWVNTALVFEIDDTLEPNLAFRFTNSEGKTEFYDIQ